MLKAIIDDDVKDFRDMIRSIVNAYDHSIEIVAEATNVTEAEIAIKKHLPDIVFLDVEMPDGTGFDLLKKFTPVFFKVIFITAFQEFSIKAFKCSAIDYILKPIDSNELKESIDKAKEIIDRDSLALKYNALLNNTTVQGQLPQKLVLKTAENIFSVTISDIVSCKADDCYTYFFLIDGKKIMVSKTMKEYYALLSPPRFFKPHHSYLINMEHFDYFSKVDGGAVIMKDQSKIPVSSRKKNDFLKLIENL